jgi:hypothetical protein
VILGRKAKAFRFWILDFGFWIVGNPHRAAICNLQSSICNLLRMSGCRSEMQPAPTIHLTYKLLKNFRPGYIFRNGLP